MTKYYTNSFSLVNLYKKPSTKTEIVTQMIYGDKFTIYRKSKKWLKIKIREDNYKGYIQNKNFPFFTKPTHKINVLKSNVYKFPNKQKKVGELPFYSKIRVLEKKSCYFKFLKGWVHNSDLKPLSFKKKDPFSNITIFKNIRYKWGGKSFKGIDCSGLIQVFRNFNNKYCPRDAKDQVKFFKKNIKLKDIKKNDIIFWKGHVALAISKKKLIHAYGPMKKTVVMDIKKTIKRIEKTANLEVIGIRRL